MTAIGGQIDKKQMSLELGADEYMLLDDAITAKKGTFDIFINTASGKVDFTQLIGMLARDGALVQVGLPGGNASINLPLTVSRYVERLVQLIIQNATPAMPVAKDIQAINIGLLITTISQSGVSCMANGGAGPTQAEDRCNDGQSKENQLEP